jgi:hypothetical protein
MELIGKKTIRQSAFAKSTTSKIMVGKGKLKFSGAAYRGIGLADKEIGIGYDESGNYLYIAEKGTGNKVKDNGDVSTMYHSKTLLEKFGIAEETAEFLISTAPVSVGDLDMDFYKITPMSAEINVEADNILEKEEIPTVDARESEFIEVANESKNEIDSNVPWPGDLTENNNTNDEVEVPSL